MTQNADHVLDHFELFRGPEYQQMLANKKKMFENPSDPAEVERIREWAKTPEYREKNFARALEFAGLGLKKMRQQSARSRDPFANARAMRQEKKLVCRIERLRHRIAKDHDATRAPLLHHPVVALGSRQRSR